MNGAMLQGQGSINTSVADTWTEALQKVMYSNDSTLAQVAYLACLGHMVDTRREAEPQVMR